MKYLDKAILINETRLDEVNMKLHLGKTATLEHQLTSYDVAQRASKLHGESAWWVTLPGDVFRYYVPVSCLYVHGDLRSGERMIIDATDAELKKIGLSQYQWAEVTLVRLVTKEEGDANPTYRDGWRIRIHHPAATASMLYWIPAQYLKPLPQSKQSTSDSYAAYECGEPNQNQKQKEKQIMNTYKVRFKQTPSHLAQQAGEKESIVATVPNILATDEYCAVAEAAADSADLIKAVRDSKGTLSVTVKND